MKDQPIHNDDSADPREELFNLVNYHVINKHETGNTSFMSSLVKVYRCQLQSRI